MIAALPTYGEGYEVGFTDGHQSGFSNGHQSGFAQRGGLVADNLDLWAAEHEKAAARSDDPVQVAENTRWAEMYRTTAQRVRVGEI